MANKWKWAIEFDLKAIGKETGYREGPNRFFPKTTVEMHAGLRFSPFLYWEIGS